MASIVDIIIESGSFKTLCAALKSAGLVDTLKGPGPWTVFAPNDDAFGKLPASAVDGLLRDIPRLKEILLYHVVQGRYMAEDVMEHERFMTVQGQDITIDTAHGVKVNNANVIQTDIEADNGVIHVIDTVIIPKVESRVEI